MSITNISVTDISHLVEYIKLHIKIYGIDNELNKSNIANANDTQKHALNKFKSHD